MLKVIIVAGIGLLLLLIMVGIYAVIVAGARADEQKGRLLKQWHEDREKRGQHESTGEEDEEGEGDP